TASRGMQPARPSTTPIICGTGSVVTSGAGNGAATFASASERAWPAKTFPDAYTRLPPVKRSAEPPLPFEAAKSPSRQREATTFPLAVSSKRVPQSVQSSTIRLRRSASTFVETSGPRIHCFMIHVWWIETFVVVLYLRKIERVLPARKQYWTVTSCAPYPIEIPSSPEPVEERWLKTTL